MTPNVAISETTPSTEQLAALQSAGLPTDDLDNGVPRAWWQSTQGNVWIGIIALERHGDIGLLRSLMVRPDQRRSGTGRELVAMVEQHATASGLDALYLLTTDADGYFSNLDYVVVDRAEVPDAVRATAQFSHLCPDSAIVMRKMLSP